MEQHTVIEETDLNTVFDRAVHGILQLFWKVVSVSNSLTRILFWCQFLILPKNEIPLWLSFWVLLFHKSFYFLSLFLLSMLHTDL